jgi:hypothetical protein
MKDDKRSTKVAKEGDVHVEPTRVNMLTKIDVSLKQLNLLKRKSELTSASGKSTMSINKPIASEEDEMGLTPSKEESTCMRTCQMAK